MIDLVISEMTVAVSGHDIRNNPGTAETKYKLSDNSAYGEVLYAISGVQSNLGRLRLIAPTTTPATTYLKRTWKVDTTWDHDFVDWQNIVTYNASSFLTSSNGGPLLTLANTYKDVYFGGVTQTAATLKEYMDGLYGEHGGYTYEQTGGGNLYMDLYNRVPILDTATANEGTAPGFSGGTWEPSETWSFTGPEYTIDPTVATVDDLCAFLIFGQPVNPEKLRFNVYIDGTIGQKGPNIAITWTNTNSESALSPELIKPHIWTYPCLGLDNPISPTFNVDVIQEDGITVPNDSILKFNNTYSWSGSMQTDYVGMADRITSQYNMISKVTLFGIDGIPNYTRYFLRFDYAEAGGDTFGELWYVDIPYEYEGAAYITPINLLNSRTNESFDTEVIVIGGTPPEEPADDPDETEQGYDGSGDTTPDGRYPTPTYKPDLTSYESTGYPGTAVLTRTYALTAAELQNVGTKLWSQSYFDVLKVQSNPIENIIACRWYPMALTGTNADIVIGDVNFGLTKPVISTTYKKTIGSFKYTGQMVDSRGNKVAPGYLAQSPFTTLKLHLPYVGTIQLDPSEIFDASLSIQYIVDLVSGDLIVFLRLDGQPYMNISGKMGVDIPLSGTDRAQVQIANASRAVSVLAGAAGATMTGNLGAAAGAISGAMSIMGSDYTTQRVCTHSSVCASYENRAVVMEVIAPKTYISNGFKKLHGLPSHQYTKLSKGMGFIKTTPMTVVNVAMSDAENAELARILATGCYF